MNTLTSRSIAVGSLLVVFLLALTAPAYAQTPTGGTIPAGTTIEDDVFLTAPDVVVDGDVDGDLFVLAQNAALNGNVTGSVFLLADRANVRGKVNGNVYALAANLNLDAAARIDHSVYAGVLSLLTTNGSVIGRDLNTLALGAQLTGNVARDTRAVIGPVEILRLLLTQAESLNLFKTSRLDAPTKRTAANSWRAEFAASCLPQLARAGSAAGGVIGRGFECLLNPSRAPRQQVAQANAGFNPGAWAANRLRDFAALALIGLIILFAFPQRLEKWSAPIAAHPLAAPGIGLLAALNGFLLTLLFVVAVIALGIIFQALTLGTLALLTWTLGLATGIAVFWVFILFLFYISQIVVAYWAARWLLKRFAPQLNLHRVIPLLGGLLVFVLLTWIPLVGALVSLLAALYGMGGIVLTWRGQLADSRQQMADGESSNVKHQTSNH